MHKEIKTKTGSKWKGLAWIFFGLLSAFALVAGLPLMSKKVPWKLEKKIATYIQSSNEVTVCHAPESDILIQKILARLYPQPQDQEDFPIQIDVIKGKTINAFATLGGQIYVYDGLLQKAGSPEELAGVLAHEMEHVRHRHIMQSVFFRVVMIEMAALVFDPQSALDPRILNLLIHLRFSREQEAEADHDGLIRLQQAKIDVMGFAHFFEREENASAIPAMLSDHPSSENRSALARQFYRADTLPVLSKEEWSQLRQVCVSQKDR